MSIVEKLNDIINENSILEDSFIEKSRSQYKSYKDFILKYSFQEQSNKRITLYSEEIPIHKYRANIKT